MIPLTRTALAAALLVLAAGLGGCDAEPEEPRTDHPAPVVTAEPMPRFEGRLDVRLYAGRVRYGDPACTTPSAANAACDPATGREYLLLGDGAKDALTSAKMILRGGGTSWSARFELGDAAALRTTRAEARGVGAAVLVVGADRRVLVMAGVPDVGAGRIELSMTHSRELAAAIAVVEPAAGA